jgi:hypothetical protein
MATSSGGLIGNYPTSNKLSLRSRDYPGYPKFTVPVMAVALLAPPAP